MNTSHASFCMRFVLLPKCTLTSATCIISRKHMQIIPWKNEALWIFSPTATLLKSDFSSSHRTRLQKGAPHKLFQQIYGLPIFRRCCCNSKKKRNLPSIRRNKATWELLAGVSATICAMRCNLLYIHSQNQCSVTSCAKEETKQHHETVWVENI